MPTRYEAADRRTGKLIRQNRAEFHNLRLRFPFDYLNVAGVKREVKAMYGRMEKRNRAVYIDIAMAVYADLSESEAAALVDGVLSAYDPVTGYVYTREISRKRDRTAEGMLAAASRSALSASVERSRRLWETQSLQFADEVVDAAMLRKFRDAGVTRVKWISVEDESRCGRCADLHGRIFKIDEIPAKQHLHCRCYVVPVE